MRGPHKKKGCVGAKAPTLFIEKISSFFIGSPGFHLGRGSALRVGVLNRPGFRPRPFFWLLLAAHEDPVSEVFKVPVSVSVPFNHFDLVVRSLGETIRIRMVKSIQNVLRPVGQHCQTCIEFF